MKLIITIDNVIYKLFNIVSPLRRHYWRKAAQIIQRNLDYEHNQRDYYNQVHGSNLCTKEAIRRFV